jgi:hypothetical protein
MGKFLPDALLLGLLVYAGSSAQVQATEPARGAPPRMWKVVKPAEDGTPTTFYFLAATHYGLPAEYDSYFDTRVLPAFDRADSLSYEGAGGREDEPNPVCDPSVLNRKGQNILARARASAADQYFHAMERLEHRQMEKAGAHDPGSLAMRKRTARLVVANLDEFDLILFYRTFRQAAVTEKESSEVSDPNLMAKGNPAYVLRGRRPDIAVRDVDTKYGSKRAYCAAGAARIRMLESLFQPDISGSAAWAKKIPRLQGEFLSLLAEGKVRAGTAMDTLSAMDTTLVCQRNREWLRDMENIADGKIHFYVIGARHFFDVDHDSVHCKGLLAAFAERGMPGTPVQ